MASRSSRWNSKSALPPELPAIHDDPYDRFIIATAKLNQWAVVTEDERFADYGIEVIGQH